MNRTATIARLKAEISTNAKYENIVRAKLAKLYEYEAMTDEQFEARMAAAKAATVARMAREVR